MEAVIRPIATAPNRQVHLIEPSGFNDAEEIAEKFKADIPVIVNLQAMESEVAKRLIDFAAGLTFGLDGRIQRVAEKVFLLTPRNVEVSAEERRRLQERGFFNQA
jgi:cell division inhibitor SepF